MSYIYIHVYSLKRDQHRCTKPTKPTRLLIFPTHQLSNHLSQSLRSPPFLPIYLFIMYTLPYDILHVAIYKGGTIDIQ